MVGGSPYSLKAQKSFLKGGHWICLACLSAQFGAIYLNAVFLKG